ncbi:hypothetical protein PG991_014695 [Apiospora marii]|uniref:White collar 1 protein n=1 Tax=Apiospora marii TaxID=335849 RepID=A0ABR1R555_9PEZI
MDHGSLKGFRQSDVAESFTGATPGSYIPGQFLAQEVEGGTDHSRFDASAYSGCTGPFFSSADSVMTDAPSQAAAPAAPAAVDSSWPFDITLALDVLERRPNPLLDLGAATLLRPLVVTDAHDPHDRVIFVSDSFLALTGYSRDEVLGSNCRFLQAPPGSHSAVVPGAPRTAISSASAYLLKQKVGGRLEASHTIINFKKSGEAFVNHLALVPIPWGPATAPSFVFGFANWAESRRLGGAWVVGVMAPSTGGHDGNAIAEEDAGVVGGKLMHGNPEGPANGFQSESEEGKCRGDGQEDEDVDPVSAALAWERSLGENTDVLVQVVSLQGSIAYASTSHKTLGYDSSALVGQSIRGLYHPSEVAVLTRRLKSHEIADLDLTLRLKRRSGHYEWFRCTASVWDDEGAELRVTLTLLRQPVGRLSRRDLHGDKSENNNPTRHCIWIKLATSGLILHLLVDPRKALGIAAEDLVGTQLQELIPQHEARAEFASLLDAAGRGERASATLALVGGRGHRLEASIVLHPGPPNTGPGGRADPQRRPYYLLARLGVVRSSSTRRKAPTLSPRSKERNSLSASPSTGEASSRSSKYEHEAGRGGGVDDDVNDDDILQDLDADRCGPLNSEVHRLAAANQDLREQVQELVRHAAQRRRAKRNGEISGGCVSCHTRVAPEWRRGPGGKRNLCNRCGLRWAKTRRGSEDVSNANPS